jgi:Saxitoxin biosynthesis operon protein SxtJ
MSGSLHESLAREDDLRPGSERSFGLVMAAALGVLALVQLWHGRMLAPALLGTAAAGFAVCALSAPRLLRGPNALWFRFGLLLGKVVSPVVMALLFFVVITPIGLLMRLVGQRPLALGLDRGAKTYWIARTAPAPASMRKQY